MDSSYSQSLKVQSELRPQQLRLPSRKNAIASDPLDLLSSHSRVLRTPIKSHSLSLPFSIFIFQQKTPFRHSPKPTKHHSTTPNDVPPPPPRRHNQPAPRAIPLPPTRTTPDPDAAAPAPPQQLQHHHNHKHRPVLLAAPTPGSRTVHPLCARAAHLHHAAGAV